MIKRSDNIQTPNSFRRTFRLIFVLFSLYLLGDALYRWDGFSYYASFSEFLPSVSLAFILWSIIAALCSMALWISFRMASAAIRFTGIEVELDQLLLYTGFLIFLGGLAWMGKKLLWSGVHTTISVKLTVFLFDVVIASVFAWVFRHKAGQWVQIIQSRITPLVWLFGLYFIFSIPYVSYHAWFKETSLKSPGISAKQSVPKDGRSNFILVTFDALSARHMSAYGYHRDTTPFIRQWAKNATSFTKAEADSNFTTPAAASLMTGKRVWTHQTYHIEGSIPVKSNIESLPAELKKHGYHNIALVVNPFASVRILGMADSFESAPLASEFSSSDSLFGWKFGIIDKILYRAFGERIRFHNWILSNEFVLSKFFNLISRNITETTVPPEKAFDRLLDLVNTKIPGPFFAWVHLFPPHDPYLPPEPHRGEFAVSGELRSYKQQERLIEESYKYLFQAHRYPEEMEQSVRLMRDYYDEYIKYIDKSFESFIRQLDEKKLENTFILLSADHGESFGHGYFTHGGPFLYEQVTHIPLIIKEPGQSRGQVFRERVEQIDIAATILDLSNIPVPPWMEGRSLVPIMRGEGLPERPVFSMNFQENRSRGHEIRSGSVAVWEDNYKLIYYLEKDESLLFNLKEDPEEVNDLIDGEPATARRLLYILEKNLERANNRMGKME